MKDKTDQNNNDRHNATLKLKVKKKKNWEILHLSWAAVPGMDR